MKYKIVEKPEDEAQTEEQIMKRRGFCRIYDCGSLVYRLDPQTT